MLIFENKISQNRDAFIAKVEMVAAELDIDPNWLMAVMKKESNFNPTIRNSYSGAVGLIQFLPSTLNGLFGMSPEDMRALSNIEQLDYVERYLLQYRNRITSYTDTYLAVFYPAAIGKDDDYEFPQSIYAGNANMDMDMDGAISVKDVKKWLMDGIPDDWKKIFEEKRSVFEKFFRRNVIGIVAFALLIMALTYFFLTQLYK